MLTRRSGTVLRGRNLSAQCGRRTPAGYSLASNPYLIIDDINVVIWLVFKIGGRSFGGLLLCEKRN